MTGFATKLLPSLAALGAMLALWPSTPAQAATFTKTYVSNTGSDVNDCSSVATACATFQHAHNQTSGGGEISVVNTGSYGQVVIGKSVQITNDGAGEASIQAIPNTALLILAGVGDVASVPGLTIDGRNAGDVGILVAQASAVHIQNCVIRNIQGIGPFGLLFAANTNSPTQLFVSDTIIFNNGSTANTGGVGIF